MRANKIEQIIREHYAGVNPSVPTCDGFVCGAPDTDVTGVVTTFTVTADVLREAERKNANMIITHEPTFFIECRGAWTQKDAVFSELRRMVREGNFVIWRCHDMMHAAVPDDIYEGFTDAMDWRAYAQPAREKSGDLNRFEEDFFDYYDIPQTTLSGVAAEMKQKLGLRAVRCAGDALRPCTRVGVLVGGGSLGFGRMPELPLRLLQKKSLDVLVCGEIMELLLGTYMADAAALGAPGGMIVLGHERSEEWGMRAMHAWLAKELSVPVAFVDAKEPFYYL